MSFRVLLLKYNLRTPLLVSLSIVGTNHHFSHQNRHQLADELRTNLKFGLPVGLRRAHAKTVEEISRDAFASTVSVRQMLTKSYLGADGKLKRYSRDGTNCTLSTSSGFYVTNGTIKVVLTSARAVGSAKQVDVYNQKWHKVFNVVYREPELDLALLELAPTGNDNVRSTGTPVRNKPMVEPSGLRMSSIQPYCSQEVVAVGQMWNNKFVTNGIISHPRRTGHAITKIGKKYGFISPGVDYIQHTASFAFDEYGGALLDLNGDVVGLYFYLQLVDNLTIYFAIPSKELIGFIRRALNGKTSTYVTAESDRAYEDVTDQDQPTSGQTGKAGDPTKTSKQEEWRKKSKGKSKKQY